MTDTSAIVAVCLADPIARDLAIRTIAREGATGQAVSITEIQDICKIRGGGGVVIPWDILIYDLLPRDEGLLDLLESLHQNQQALQVLIYTQPQPGDGKLLSSALKLDGTVVKHRFENGMERLRLGDVLRQLIGNIPTRRVHGLIRLLVPDVPHRANQFIARALDRIHNATSLQTVTVQSIAHDLGTTVRTVERSLASTPLPPPKELIDWLTLQYCLLMTPPPHKGRITGRHGRQCSGVKWYRLRSKLLVSHIAAAQESLRNEFDITFMAFAERCGVTAADVKSILATND